MGFIILCIFCISRCAVALKDSRINTDYVHSGGSLQNIWTLRLSSVYLVSLLSFRLVPQFLLVVYISSESINAVHTVVLFR